MTGQSAPELNERQTAVLGILYEHEGRSGIEAAAVGQHLMRLGLIDDAWGQVGTQAGGMGARVYATNSGPTRATRSAQKTLRWLVDEGYVRAIRDYISRYKLTETGLQAAPK